MLVAKSGFVDGIRLGRSARITNTGLYLNNGNPKFGQTSLFGSAAQNAMITVTPYADMALGTGNFTIEFWYNAAAVNSDVTCFGMRPPGGNGNYPTVAVLTNGAVLYYTQAANKIVTATGVIVINTWQSIAVVRYAGVTKIYVNGVQTGSSFTDTINYLAGSCVVAANDFTQSGAYQIKGRMDELRVSNVARYTGNYTPATEPFTDDANTLLLLHFEGTNAGQTLVDDNS